MNATKSIYFSCKLKDHSVFLNLDHVVQRESFEKIYKIYESVRNNIFAYDSSHLVILKKVENTLYQRMIAQIKRDSSSIIKIICTLGIYLLFTYYKLYKVRSSHSQFLTQFKLLEDKLETKEVIPRLADVWKLQEKYLSDPNQEIKRLLQVHRVLKTCTFKDPALITLKEFDYIRLNTQQKIAWYRSLELQELLKDTHYVLNHGLNYPLVSLMSLASVLEKKFSKFDSRGSSVLRNKHIYKESDVKGYTADWFKKYLFAFHHDGRYSKYLISADIDLTNTAKWESALGFYARESNITLWYRGNSWIKKEMRSLLSFYFKDKSTINKIVEEVIQVFNQPEHLNSGAGLYSICVPKNQYNKVFYLAKPYGYKYGELSQEYLSSIQSGDQQVYNYYGDLQVRVLGHMMDKSNGVFTIAHRANHTEEQTLHKDLEHILDKYFYKLET